jgi:nicotinamide-nucleotide amidase
MIAAIISIGDELLSGFRQNSNANFIACRLAELGISVQSVTVVGDSEPAIIHALENIPPGCNFVFVTGGLGPTHDDITKIALTRYFNSQLIFHEKVYDNIQKLFQRKSREVSDLQRLQAYLPDNCTLIPNTIGTASGMIFEKGQQQIYVLPGVPAEMEQMLLSSIIPELETYKQAPIRYKTVHVFGIPESQLYQQIKDWITNQNLKIAILPNFNFVDIVLSSNLPDGKQLLVDACIELKKILGDSIFGVDQDTMEAVVGKLLVENNLNFAVAESCTGGLIANLLTNVPGSSDYFQMGIVTYSNQSKIQRLGVKEESIQQNGAVSAIVATEMAAGIAHLAGTDIGLSTTGIAGPGGGSPEKPVGIVFIGLVIHNNVASYKFHFAADRLTNKYLFAQAALNQLRLAILHGKH